jgi:MoaA/NifB/PqqE/SkfB family radical SAM enzyme
MEPTQKLFSLASTKVLHLELTTRCNAACPQCDRVWPNSGYSRDHELTLTQVQELFPVEFVQGLDKMFACGTFGDPAAARECLSIFRWFREVNPNITLGMNTNGGLRDVEFWMELGKLMCNPLDYVVFSIDGMASTNDIYRKGVMWHRVMLNTETFIASGGRAHWDMLIFQHNQHHVTNCREHAKKMGFVRFRTKVSSRFADRPVKFLNPPKGFKAVTPTGPVQCHAAQEHSLYVAATGQILPCCFIGGEVFKMTEELRQLVDNPEDLVASWSTNPHPVCTRNCATHQSKTHFEQQFYEETAFD